MGSDSILPPCQYFSTCKIETVGALWRYAWDSISKVPWNLQRCEQSISGGLFDPCWGFQAWPCLITGCAEEQECVLGSKSIAGVQLFFPSSDDKASRAQRGEFGESLRAAGAVPANGWSVCSKSGLSCFQALASPYPSAGSYHLCSFWPQITAALLSPMPPTWASTYSLWSAYTSLLFFLLSLILPAPGCNSIWVQASRISFILLLQTPPLSNALLQSLLCMCLWLYPGNSPRQGTQMPVWGFLHIVF